MVVKYLRSFCEDFASEKLILFIAILMISFMVEKKILNILGQHLQNVLINSYNCSKTTTEKKNNRHYCFEIIG